MPSGLCERDEAVLHRIGLNEAYAQSILFLALADTSRLLPDRCAVGEGLKHVLCTCPLCEREGNTGGVSLGLPAPARTNLFQWEP